jgi:hypothetical protein
MQKTKAGSILQVVRNRRSGAQIVPLEYAGKWVAWSASGREIVAVAASYNACERAAGLSGFDADQVAIERVPTSRQRVTGRGL